MSLTNQPDPEARARVVAQDLQNVMHPIVQHRALEKSQLVVTGAQGSTIVDADGSTYLDAMAGLWCVNIGYGRTELAQIAAEQMEQVAYYPHTAMNLPAARLAEQINALMGGGYHTYFVNSGSEANEAGFKVARQYAKHEFPGQFRFKTIARYYAYHGTTLATLAAGGMGERKMKFEPFAGEFIHVPAPTCYRCPLGLEYPSCKVACAKAIETTILGEGPQTVAEVIVEPIMSGVGVAVPPDEYLPMVEAICRKYDVLLHVDEVINGFGRTGKMFGHQHYGISPDIMAVAKGIVSAYLPIAATVVKDSVFNSFLGEVAEARQVMQVNTYGGHPAAAAVAVRNIEIMLEEKLADRSATMGAHLIEGLRERLFRHAITGDVRGKGLLIGIELVTDRESRTQLDGALVQGVVDFCKANGVIVGRSGGGARHSNTIVLSPPLIITRSECDTLIEVLDKALAATVARMAGQG
ncbi:aminotransferase class III-fold pyridoxal phosphate-dependent enzyme [Roseomonas alkaliterrae]|uniref:Adenosylmethionine-8-amino-7-oxononanoate aminotransferase n=1 Tax=Neoroseomonas alkaliterrae TaxID=1452450 RepID=A0A840XSF3_9PROT|nr:aminotransferase [Neoroseomonas alkaliterrae]MBB5691475.1 adenosylmethionine-8-amino-7-oxononanoate aminotransferase [Neoroseomonas alkaliterrae]MBR0675681.1 aminotransferase class III-fold pyridoxal phosphate-dependent enzyme [Neoroseomonas alkaliterrae]